MATQIATITKANSQGDEATVQTRVKQALWELRLYVAGMTTSVRAFDNLKKICEEYLGCLHHPSDRSAEASCARQRRPDYRRSCAGAAVADYGEENYR